MSVSPHPPPPQPCGSCREEKGQHRAADTAVPVEVQAQTKHSASCHRTQSRDKQEQRRSGCGWQPSSHEGHSCDFYSSSYSPGVPAAWPQPHTEALGAVAQSLQLRDHSGGPRGTGCGGRGLREQLWRRHLSTPPSLHGQNCSHSPFKSFIDCSFLNSTSCLGKKAGGETEIIEKVWRVDQPCGTRKG